MSRSAASFSIYLERLGAFISGAPSDDIFEQLALDLFALQFRAVSPYRRLCERRGQSPESVRRWTDIPAVPIAAFKEFDLTSVPPGQRGVVFHSSGTGGHRPSRHFHDAASLALYERSVLGAFRKLWPGGGERLPWLCLTPPPEQAPHSSLVHMFDILRRAAGGPGSEFLAEVGPDGAWTVNFAEARRAVDRVSSGGNPVWLAGPAFAFVHWLEDLGGRTCPLPGGSFLLETGGYKGRSRGLPKPILYEQLEKTFGVAGHRIISEYSMCELSSQAYALGAPQSAEEPDDTFCPSAIANRKSQIANQPSAVFRFPPWARVRILSPETGLESAAGETGLIQVYDLANARSVLAILTGDLATRHENGFQLLGRAPEFEPRGCSLMLE